MGGWAWVPWVLPCLVRPYKVLSMGASSRARATPVAGGERGKPTLVEARHHQEEDQEEMVRRLMVRRGFSCPQAKAAPAIPMEGGGGRLLARMSLALGSLVASLEVNNNIVAAAVTTASHSTTTTDSTATSRTRASTTKTRGSTTRTRVQQPKQRTVPVRLQPDFPRPEREHTRSL